MKRIAYKSARGKLYHKYNCSKLQKCKSTVKYYDKDSCTGKTLCEQCYHTCMICLSQPGWETCTKHSVCDDCLKNHISYNTKYDISCPCGTGKLDPRDFSKECFDLWIKNIGNETIIKVDKTDEYSDLLNEHCPKCNKVFYDFDACAALYCSCGAFFCGFCFKEHKNMDDNHSHVQKCKLNPKKELYIRLEEWKRIRSQQKYKQRIYYYRNLSKECNFIECIYFWKKLYKFNTFLENMVFLIYLFF